MADGSSDATAAKTLKNYHTPSVENIIMCCVAESTKDSL